MDVKARALLTAQERTAEKDHGWSEDQRVVRKHGRGWLSTRLVVDQTVTTTLVQEVHMLVTSYSITLYCPNCRGFHPIICTTCSDTIKFTQIELTSSAVVC